MPGEDDRNKGYYGERPPPTVDPTKLTTDAVKTLEDKVKELWRAELTGLRELMLEKFDGVQTQITERDEARDQAKIDANERIAAALQAQKEAVGKTETSFGDQFKSIVSTINALGDGIRREISDLKDRQNVNDGSKKGIAENMAFLVAVAAVIIAGLGLLVAIAVLFLTHAH